MKKKTTSMKPQTPDNEVACHYCGAGTYSLPCEGDETTYWKCGTDYVEEWGFARSSDCYEFELTEKNNEVARLRKYIERLEIYSPENEWSLPEWRKLVGSKEQNEDPETLLRLYQFRLEPDIRGETNEVARLHELLNRAIDYTKDALFFARTHDNKIQWNELDKLWGCVCDLEKEKLAFATEEPVTEKPSKFSVSPSLSEKCNVCGESYGDHTGHPDDPHCPLQEPDQDHLHAWMQLQESINKDISGELRYLRDEIQKLKQK